MTTDRYDHLDGRMELTYTGDFVKWEDYQRLYETLEDMREFIGTAHTPYEHALLRWWKWTPRIHGRSRPTHASASPARRRATRTACAG